MRDFFHTGLNVSRSDLQAMLLADYPGGKWYVSRNRGSISGDGKNWDQAFLTWGEAVAAVNLGYSTAAFPTRGRNWLILVDEGWYGEQTMTLSASDGTILGTGSGTAGRSVLYGSLTAGGFDDGNTGPALAITGGNNTFMNFDVVNRSATISGVYNNAGNPTEHPCLLEGTYLVPVTYNKYVGINFMRDQVDAASWGLISYNADHLLFENGILNGTSLKLGGIVFVSLLFF